MLYTTSLVAAATFAVCQIAPAQALDSSALEQEHYVLPGPDGPDLPPVRDLPERDDGESDPWVSEDQDKHNQELLAKSDFCVSCSVTPGWAKECSECYFLNNPNLNFDAILPQLMNVHVPRGEKEHREEKREVRKGLTSEESALLEAGGPIAEYVKFLLKLVSKVSRRGYGQVYPAAAEDTAVPLSSTYLMAAGTETKTLMNVPPVPTEPATQAQSTSQELPTLTFGTTPSKPSIYSMRPVLENLPDETPSAQATPGDDHNVPPMVVAGARQTAASALGLVIVGVAAFALL